MGILIRGGRVVDAAAQIDKIADVYLDDGVIQKVNFARFMQNKINFGKKFYVKRF